MGARVIVGSANNKISSQLAQFLNDNGYNVVGETGDGYEYLRRVHTVYPDLVIIDNNLKGIGGQELAEVLLAESICPVIVMVRECDRQFFVNLEQDPMLALLVKPLNRMIMLNTIDLLVKMSKSINKLEKEVKQLKTKQDVKQLTDKAKKLLMANERLTEEEAHRKIQKESMNRGMSKAKVAEAIILTYEK